MKRINTFALYFAKVCFRVFESVVFFIAASSAINAANIGYQIPAVYYTSKVGKCTLASSGGDSLSYFNNLIFLTQMPKYEKNYRAAKHSTCHVTPDCESVTASKEKQYDFSKFNYYLNDVVHPEPLAERLEQILASYLDMSIYVLMANAGMKPLEICVNDDIQNHVSFLNDLIKLFKELHS